MTTNPAELRAEHTVLIVEDDEDLRELMRGALEMNGYSVVIAEDGGAAFDRLADIGRPCVILLDLVMDGMNGWDFFAALRTRPEFIDVPVVVHSSAASNAPGGVTRVVRKPMNLDRLLMVVGEFCTPRQTHS